jgi:hypothetical protein
MGNENKASRFIPHGFGVLEKKRDKKRLHHVFQLRFYGLQPQSLYEVFYVIIQKLDFPKDRADKYGHHYHG